MIVSDPPPCCGRHRARRTEERLGLRHRRRIETAAQRAPGAALRRIVRARETRDRVEYDDDILALLDEPARALERHVRDVDVPFRRLVEARGDDFAASPFDHLAHFLGTLVHEQHEQRRLGMIDRDPLGDRLQQHRLSGARRRHDQGALAVADRRDQIDRPACELGADLRRLSRLEHELALGIGCGERAEIRAAEAAGGVAAIHGGHFCHREPAALVATRRRLDQVAAPKRELTHELRRDERIVRRREVALLGAAYEPAIARRIEPSGGGAVGDEYGHRRIRVLVGTWTIALAAAASPPAIGIGVVADVSIPVVPISVVATVALFAIAAIVLALAIALVVSVVVVPRLAADARSPRSFCGGELYGGCCGCGGPGIPASPPSEGGAGLLSGSAVSLGAGREESSRYGLDSVFESSGGRPGGRCPRPRRVGRRRSFMLRKVS